LVFDVKNNCFFPFRPEINFAQAQNLKLPELITAGATMPLFISIYKARVKKATELRIIIICYRNMLNSFSPQR